MPATRAPRRRRVTTTTEAEETGSRGGSPAKRKPAKKERESRKKAGKGRKATKSKGAKRRRKKRPPAFTARTADRHVLYQLSVQSPEEDVRFLSRVYRKVRGKVPLHFREDFCGTAYLTSGWIKRGKKYTAEGFDIDPDTIAWGIEHNFEPLGENAARAMLHVKDVRARSHRPPDVRCAQNFSYFVFKERRELMEYLRSAHADLADDGVFVMDIYGGPESMQELEEEREIEEGFTYVWDQKSYWPATGDYLAYIHFRFEDGSEMKRAFKYDWRLWTLTELKDALLEVGFAQVDTYWEGTEADGESGNGIYRKSLRGENCEAWVTYLVAYK